MKSIIENLKRLDLSKRPEKEIRTELNNISCLPFMTNPISPYEVIHRAVLNTDTKTIFCKVSRLSFKPKKYNTDFQRASTPNNTMFYGCVISGDISKEEIPNARLICAAETCDLIRNVNAVDGEQVITFGKWRVKEILDLVTIIDPVKKYTVKRLNELANVYMVELNKYPTNVSNEIKEALTYFTNEFSKKVNQNENHNYMISAILTEMLVTHKNNQADGVIYPSVQADEDGLCVAIHPNSMHKLELIEVLQCKAVRKGYVVELLNEKFCKVSPPNSDFVLEDV